MHRSLRCLKSVALPTELPGLNCQRFSQSKLPKPQRPAGSGRSRPAATPFRSSHQVQKILNSRVVAGSLVVRFNLSQAPSEYGGDDPVHTTVIRGSRDCSWGDWVMPIGKRIRSTPTRALGRGVILASGGSC